jgi:hypothetical protein
MAGAAASPVLADISRHFPEAEPCFVRMIITLPALIIIPFSFLTGTIAKRYRKRTLALIGLTGYLTGRLGDGLAGSIKHYRYAFSKNQVIDKYLFRDSQL